MQRLLGRKLKNDVTSPNGLTIIPAQTILLEEHLTLISKHHVDILDITLIEDKATILQNQMKGMINKSLELFDYIGSSSKIPVNELTSKLVPELREFVANTSIYELLDTLKSQDDYTYQHNIAVGAIATLLGTWLNLEEEELSLLTLAATLHDVGKVKIPNEILNKPAKLTTEEFDIMKKHTIFGYELLVGTFGEKHNVSLVALQHHEKGNGKGYPYGLKRNNIHFHSKIVMIADIFHAMSSKRVYHESMPFFEVINQMKKFAYGEMDAKILSVFVNNMIDRLVGQKVRLVDGRICRVVFIYPFGHDAIFYTENGEFLDSREDNNLQIQEVFFY
ncbi:HD-GYP domain-containing protein [Paenibacillus sp. DMB5]|uniref:HD-GYP domain-containing protein n=1 Tax=Paenibacillus sp. DMB5 TaxID=1780103 RepID=UPI00076BE2B9|nr:HD-GYP domain-containing protein [Paenibacillus sp. DMB5]KUP25815.1 hypothetical protein AWJ19_19520 [Paenibacillus sp. DMB5]